MITLINGIMTAVLLILFVGIWIWAWSSKNRKKFDLMAKLPLEDQPREKEGKNND